jgi:hypothetical protein
MAQAWPKGIDTAYDWERLQEKRDLDLKKEGRSVPQDVKPYLGLPLHEHPELPRWLAELHAHEVPRYEALRSQHYLCREVIGPVGQGLELHPKRAAALVCLQCFYRCCRARWELDRRVELRLALGRSTLLHAWRKAAPLPVRYIERDGMAHEDMRSTLFRAEEAERAEYERLRRLAEDRYFPHEDYPLAHLYICCLAPFPSRRSMLAEDARVRLGMAQEIAGQRMKYVLKMPRKVKLARRHSVSSTPFVRRSEYARDWEMRNPHPGTVKSVRVNEMKRVTVQLVEVLELQLKSITGDDTDSEQEKEEGKGGDENEDEGEDDDRPKKVKEGEREGINAYCIIRFAKDVEAEEGPLAKDLEAEARRLAVLAQAEKDKEKDAAAEEARKAKLHEVDQDSDEEEERERLEQEKMKPKVPCHLRHSERFRFSGRSATVPNSLEPIFPFAERFGVTFAPRDQMKNPLLKIEVWHEGDKAKRGRAEGAVPEPDTLLGSITLVRLIVYTCYSR